MAYNCVVTYNACVSILFSLLSLSLFSPAFLLLCRWGGCVSRVLDEDFYKQPFSELIGYVYVAPTNILPSHTFAFFSPIVINSSISQGISNLSLCCHVLAPSLVFNF